MNGIVAMETGITFGAAVTLTAIEDYIQDIIDQHVNDHKYNSLRAFIQVLHEFAALQLKNMVTIGGCVASAWSNSDVIPLFCALGAIVQLASSGNPSRSVVVDECFFKGLGRTIIADGEVILSVTLTFVNKDQYAYTIKQSRCDFDTAIISMSALVTLDEERKTLKDLKVFLGNILPSVYFARNLSEKLSGKCCETSLTSDALSCLQDDFLVVERLSKEKLGADVKSLTEATIWTLMMKIMCDVHGEDAIPADERQAIYPLDRSYIESTQVFEEVPADHPESDGVGRPIVHRSARQQATGEALFIDDTPHYENELYLSLVTSKYGHARILKVDPSEALRVSGVVDVITHKNIPGKNQYGLINQDEVVFAVEEVEFYGQIIAAVIATTEDIAKRAAELVDVTYQPLPCITTIQEAIKADSYIGNWKTLHIGDTDSGFKEADEILQGEIEIGGQEHFYMETTRALVVPLKEDDQLKVFAPVQGGDLLQKIISSVLDIPYSRIGVDTKRIGGSFGGKVLKVLVALPVALAAHRLKRPVRCVLDRDTDMQITGGRHPVLAQYKVGVKKSGLVTALELKFYLNAGCTTDMSPAVLDVLCLSFDNCYQIPNVQINGRICKTNLPSNTAMRGFGHPQMTCVVETWMQHVAERLDLNPEQVRELNMRKSGEILAFNGNPETSTFERTWNELKLKSDFQVRRREVEEFNSLNKYRKRGIHVGPLTYGLHHIASRALGVPVENIHINSTNTNIVPNAISSGGSITSLSNGAAVMDACQQLKKRIKPYKDANPNGTMTDWVRAAYFERVSLSATGIYRPDMTNFGYDWETGEGRGWYYYTSGAACSEVEVDIITGQHVVRRVDIVMDVGKSLNPAIDIGQIEGAFLQFLSITCLSYYTHMPDRVGELVLSWLEELV
ncbi:hypothetical protein LSH36_137g03000 [Paralvinella palmiformis]|uniref:FAD-binding PCMH-type domain-containing protein n=1 Tax=Paralvinella palmiformis TaxID=53620 RepID=A0AAD9JVL3_9ANNE|nr:hypothetical protein LSH36_137g03000 [Paralvinella palmiformis]